jgi:uncharacterized protein (TIGR00297 family)
MIAFGIQEIVVFVFLTTLMVFCWRYKKLTLKGVFAAAIIGVSVYLADHWRGLMLLLVFFLISVVATSHRKDIKLKIHSKSTQISGRTAGQVFANGGIAALCAIISLIDPAHLATYLVMMASSIASALGDTLSSELGIIYGRRFYNILTLKPDQNGLDGVVSVEGTLIGALGSLLVGVSFAGFSLAAFIIGLAGILGNFSDSIIGATLERKDIVGNNLVNFLNTLIAAVAGLLLYLSITP